MTAHPSAVAPVAARRWSILVCILLARCMDLLDGPMTNVAAADIVRELRASDNQLQWILSAYSLTFAVGLVCGARLGDIFGRRRLFLTGIAIYLAAAIGCALSPTAEALICFRLAQGLGAALLVPQGLGLIKSVFRPDELGRAVSAFGPAIGLSLLIAPVGAGLLVQGNLFGADWRSVFLVHLPFGLAAAVGARRLFPESLIRPAPQLDILGCILVALLVGLLIYPLIQGREAGWPPWTFLMMVGSVVVLAALIGWTRWRTRRGIDPLVVPSVFGHRAYSGGIAITLVLFVVMIGTVFALTMFFRFGQHRSAIGAGLALTPFAVGLPVGAVLSSAVVVPRIGRTALQVGAGLMAVGAWWNWGVVRAEALNTSAWDLSPGLLVIGTGTGMLLVPLINFVLSPVRSVEVGSATGVFNSTQQLAGAAGVAVIGSVFFTVLADEGFVAAYSRCLLIEVGLAVILLVLCWLLPKRAPETWEV